MLNISEQRLISMALDALEEVAASTHSAPARRTWALRLVLAFLASRAGDGQDGSRWAFDHFWRSIHHERPQDRWANVNAALNGIYLAVGQKRDLRRVTRFERGARER